MSGKPGHRSERTSKVLAWLEANPAASLADCARALGLEAVTVRSISSRYLKKGARPKMAAKEKMRRAKLWLWLSSHRVAKWNKLRAAEGQPPATRDQMAECLAGLDEATVEAVKERIR